MKPCESMKIPATKGWDCFWHSHWWKLETVSMSQILWVFESLKRLRTHETFIFVWWLKWSSKEEKHVWAKGFVCVNTGQKYANSLKSLNKNLYNIKENRALATLWTIFCYPQKKHAHTHQNVLRFQQGNLQRHGSANFYLGWIRTKEF